jgi:hypothetical protein
MGDLQTAGDSVDDVGPPSPEVRACAKPPDEASATTMNEPNAPGGDLSPSPATSSLLARMFNVLVAPGEVFDEVRSAPGSTANWLVPALILMVVGAISLWLACSQPAVQQQMSEFLEKTLEKQGHAAQMNEQARAMAEKIGLISMKVSQVLQPVAAAAITPFWGGLIIWLVGAKITKGNFGYLKAVEVAGLTNVIGILEVVVRALFIVALGNMFAGPHLGLTLKEFDTSNPLHYSLAAANPLMFWGLAVQALGMAKLSGMSFAKSLAWLLAIYVLLSGCMIGCSVAMQGLGRR